MLGNRRAGDALLFGGPGDLAVLALNLAQFLGNQGHGRAGLFRLVDGLVDGGQALRHAVHRLGRSRTDRRDHGGDFLRRSSGTFGQLADLVRNHRESASLLAGAGGFDGRVERQEIGLVGNFPDRVDNRGDPPRLVSQRADDLARELHRIGHAADHCGDRTDFVAAMIGKRAGFAGVRPDLGCEVGSMGDGARHLFDRR